MEQHGPGARHPELVDTPRPALKVDPPGLLVLRYSQGGLARHPDLPVHGLPWRLSHGTTTTAVCGSWGAGKGALHARPLSFYQAGSWSLRVYTTFQHPDSTGTVTASPASHLHADTDPTCLPNMSA